MCSHDAPWTVLLTEAGTNWRADGCRENTGAAARAKQLRRRARSGRRTELLLTLALSLSSRRSLPPSRHLSHITLHLHSRVGVRAAALRALCCWAVSCW